MSKELKSRWKLQVFDLTAYHWKNMESVQLLTSDEYPLKQPHKIKTLFSLLKEKYNLFTSKARACHQLSQMIVEVK